MDVDEFAIVAFGKDSSGWHWPTLSRHDADLMCFTLTVDFALPIESVHDWLFFGQ